MRKGLVILALASAMGGCSGSPDWFAQFRPASKPVSVPTSAEPALPESHPAAATAAPAPPTAPGPLAAGDDVAKAALGRPGASSTPTTTKPAAIGTPSAMPSADRPGTVVASAPVPAPAPAPAATPASSPALAPLPAPRPGGDAGKPVSVAPSPTAKVEAPPVKPPAAGAAGLPKPPAPAAGGPVMAYVNDAPIYMDDLNRLLVAGYGMKLAQQLVANQLVDEEGRKQGLAVTEAEAQAEHERTLQEMFGDVKDANQRQRLLQQLLTRNNVSEGQWDLTMHRNALLAKLAAKRVVVTEEDLQAEFGRSYERKVEVMHIQVASLSDAQKVLRELASGAEFGAMVTKYSIGPSAKEGGVLAPFGLKDVGTPPALREAAMALKKVGEVSDPIQIGTAFHLAKLVRIIEPKDVKFADVKAALTETVRRRKTAMLQQDILQILIRGARILYVNPTLKAQAEKGS